MRGLQLLLTERIMPTKELVKSLLYGMDPKLATVLRRGRSLAKTGFHDEDLSQLFLMQSSDTPAVLVNVDYEAFNREARDECDLIATRHRSTKAQVKALAKKSTSATTPASASTPCRPPLLAASSSSETTSRLAKLTLLERKWLFATEGCFKCRKSWTSHRAPECEETTATTKIDVPSGWKAGMEVPDEYKKKTTTSKPVEAKKATVGAVSVDREVQLPEGFSEDSDSESEGYAFPLLRVVVDPNRSRCTAYALADSGSHVSLISVELVKSLGLKERKLAASVAC